MEITIFMHGQILYVAATINQGVILGDDGARYTFTPMEWQDNSVKAVSGMRVEYKAQDPYAEDVRVIQGATYSSAPVSDSLQSYQGKSIPIPPPQIPSPSPTTSVPSAATVLTDHRGQTSSNPEFRQPVVPNTPRDEKSKEAVGLLLILLGPIGAIIVSFYIGSRRKYGRLVVGIIFFPLLLLYWPIYIIVGIVFILKSDKWFAKAIHYERSHGGFPFIDKRKCLTDDCPTEFGSKCQGRSENVPEQ